MAASWAFGQQPMGIKPVPLDFIPFFSTTNGTRVDADKIDLSFSLGAASTMALTRPAAWDRVLTLSHKAAGKGRQIMKRVALYDRKAQPFMIRPEVNFTMPNTREAVASDQLVSRKVRRGANYQPISREVAFSGSSLSHAFMLQGLVQATANVANNYMNTSSCTSYEDRRAARRGICQITPLKRRADVALGGQPDVPLMITPTGGNKLGFYYKVLPIIKKAYSKGKKEVDVATASMVGFSAFLRSSRRNPRQHVAAYGVPELSDIMDDSEPESPTVVRQPVLKAESRSPAKRIARLTTPFSKTPRANRLTEGFVKLLPASRRGVFTTPRKSRNSPVPQTASPVYDFAVNSLNYSPTASEEDLPGSPKEGSPEPTGDITSSPTRSPGRTFRVPSEFDSSSINGDESIRGPPSTPNKSSPVNFSRPIAPTPSRWIRAEPTTPFTPMPQSAAPATPGQSDSPIGLHALLGPDTPKAPVCTYETPTGIDSIDFGGASPFQSNVSWMNTSSQASEAHRSQTVNHARRRRSEPVLRKLLETQARRRSASPQKLRFKSDDTFQDVISIASLFDRPSADETTILETAEDDTNETASYETANEISAVEPVTTTVDDATMADPTSAVDTTTDEPDVPAPVIDSTEIHKDDSTPTDDSAVSEIAPVEVIDEASSSDPTPTQDAEMEGPTPIVTAQEVQVTDATPINTTDEANMVDAAPTDDPTVYDATIDIATAESTVHTDVVPTPMEITITPAVENTPAKNSTAHVEMSDDDQPAANEQSIVEIDMRENPDIFGAHPSSPPAPIQNLSRMANDACDGLAKIVVTEENGRLFVRFKLPAQYAHMLPASQGFENNDLAFSPSAMASTPRTSVNTNQVASTDLPAQHNPFSPIVATPSRVFSFSSPVNASTPEMATAAERSIGDLLQTPNVTAFGTINDASPTAFQTPELPEYNDNTLVFGEAASTPQPASTKRTTRRQSAMTPLKRATTNAMTASKLTTPAKTVEPNHNTPKFATPLASDPDQTLPLSWSDVDTPAKSPSDKHDAAPVQDEPLTSASVNHVVTSTPTPAVDDAPAKDEPATITSPVDTITIAAAQDQPTTSTPADTDDTAPAQDERLSSPAEPTINAPVQDEQVSSPTATAAAVTTTSPITSSTTTTDAPVQDEQTTDSVDADRQWMHDFIKRSQKTTSSESGSSIPPSAATRQPLGDRSPNRGSPLMKRKHEDGSLGDESPPKKLKVDEPKAAAAPKKGKRTRTARHKAELAIDMVDTPTQDTELSPPADTNPASPPTTRRSSRLRGQDNITATPKSSLPTPIKLNRAGAGRGMAKKPRTEEQEWDRKTRSNTKKNMGDAETPAETLTRLKGQVEEDSDVSEGSAGGRRVGWKDPLEKIQGSTPKKGRAAPKAKATQGNTGVSKAQSTPKSTTKTTRAAKVAEGLGMVANGTPAKPQRVTRSRARNGA
ncbi:uncharacterized protein FIESC28_00722 [Fusarium coffeatum]|uniref:Uncharacterized protein n=1 Tax=Fusarium coffeatum TaxID=231269 RepID=A0A366SBY5_9HYPO|nr:uncharacterized protein FIESC28_00722 [Fusarium coffeatum]RBR26428.1 hypothetical protein FIESC28_00722 [Fusarium coffeatum]